MKRIPVLILWLCAATTASAAGQAPSEKDPTASGRLLLEQLNCTTCHAMSDVQAKWLSPEMAPRLADLGSRASADWLIRYLAAPQQVMPGTTMPDVLRSLPEADRAGAAESLTHYLLSQGPLTFRRIMPDRAAVARGESLYHHVGCVACHSPLKDEAKPVAAAVPLPQMEEKWSFDGLRRFLLNPLACRPSGRMPSMRLSDAEAADLAHYLLRKTRVPGAVELAIFRGRIASLEDVDNAELARTQPANGFLLDASLAERRAAFRFTSWVKIGQAGDYTFYLTASSASRFALDDRWLAGENSWESEKVNEKAPTHLDAGWHELRVDYVRRGNHPPAMKLEWEGPGFARGAIPVASLHSEKDAAPEPAPFVLDTAKAAAGRTLYEKLNCAACHQEMPAAKAAPSMAQWRDGRGCLAEAPPPDSPGFHFDAGQRLAIAAAIGFLNRPDLEAPTAQQQVTNLFTAFNCFACHARDGVGGAHGDRDSYFTSNVPDTGDEGRLPPRLDDVGDKLTVGWIDTVLTQGGSVRPYLDTRMPQFGKDNVGQLPALLVAIDRKPEKLASVADDPSAQREAGRTIVGTHGLSCIACHCFNGQPAQTLQVIDLITAPTRLNEDWFRRFLLDPNRYHPGTRMPAFWPDGKSLLPAVLDGDTTRQEAALWTYLSDGTRAKFPVGLSRQNVELVVGGEAVVYRGKLWEAGFRAVAIGYPGEVNAAFDAEEMRLSLLWRGRFLNVGPHWLVQGMGQIHPLGTDVVIFPHGSPLAILADAKAPWPADDSKALGMKFHGYQLDSVRRPTLLYSFGSIGIEDFLTPIERKAGLHRTIRFVAAPPEGLYFRIAAGKLAAGAATTWRLNDALTLTVNGGGTPITRGNRDRTELLVPVQFSGNDRQIEVDYVW
jgi:mono/diheme cytochrome c family protein